MYLQNKKSCLCLRKQEQVEYQNFLFFSLRQITWQGNPEKSTQSWQASPSLHVRPHPATSEFLGRPPLPPLISESGFEPITMSSNDWPTWPLTHSGWWNFMSNVSIYCPGCPRTSRKFKNQKFKFCKYRDSNPIPRRCLCRTNALTAWPQAP